MSFQCSKCESRKESAKSPRGWKVLAGKTLCDKCKKSSFYVRAFTMKVVRPIGIDWSQLRQKLKICWEEGTRLANWSLSEILRRDTPRTQDMTKLPKLPKIYIYPDARKIFPLISSSSVVSIINTVSTKYSQSRYNTRWAFSESIPSFRFPMPFPVPRPSWAVYFDKDCPIIEACLLSGEDRVQLQLKGGKEYRRQTLDLRKIASGEIEAGELKLVCKNGEVFVKIACWLPKGEESGRQNTMYVTSTPDALLVAGIGESGEKASPWIYNANHIRRLVNGHGVFLQRMSEDVKFERRFGSRKLRSFNVDKFNNRMNSFCSQMASSLVKYAVRQKVSVLAYDDRDHSYMPKFRWFYLKTCIKNRCERDGVRLIEVK